MAEIEEGDEVFIYSAGTAGSPAKVVKIGRTLVHIQQRQGRIETYDRTTQRRSGRQVGTGAYFRTIEQAQAAKRDGSALRALEECGLSIKAGSMFTTEQIEALVKLVRTFGGKR